ncbi:YbaB/EbfC family nucleoid-associated protein [Oceanibacterium hippocampi]|uniref:Nucleoid-associated protein OCH7691_00715 n=1 Tax=Oceanibacterium hippocampi TaxID=745714 RepID=A0A1Y5RY00_9PROT|nr:YbaB/EbfC family nucleoid-associated protein [Oceanibacterium hippocampi]SLN25244.1 Nucleoid-associated protein [Oceanibacterium hippocampi]
MKNLANLMKQAQEMQGKMAEMQASLEGHEETGSAGAGMVEVTLNGRSELRRVKIDPSLANPDDLEMIEDLLVAAHKDAKAKVEAFSAEKMQELTGGLQLPGGMKLPF